MIAILPGFNLTAADIEHLRDTAVSFGLSGQNSDRRVAHCGRHSRYERLTRVSRWLNQWPSTT
ncbi:hypothetical protein E0H36_26025 [Rhizobium leguminosarum bv. viciae]|nr:hypothetical protein E0H36_26025 [Rhizobium leguminosarum bv. viciae]TBZ68840.1 hypothetical protein E0H43_23610 [Rhizobium leguminosarum bv. viciae]